MPAQPKSLCLSKEENEQVRDWLVTTRANLKMTQKSLAEATGMSIPMISHMENGISNMSVVTALMLLKVLPDPPEIYHGIRQKMLLHDTFTF